MAFIDFLRKKILAQAGNSMAQKMMPFVLNEMHTAATGMKEQEYRRGLEDLELLRNAVVRGKIFYIMDLPWVLVYLGILYIIHPLMGGAAIAAVFVVALFHILLRVLEKNRYTIADIAFQANTDFVKTSLVHAEIVSAMGMMPAVLEKYSKRNDNVLSIRSEADAYQTAVGSIIRLIYLITTAAVFGVGAYIFFTYQVTAGAIFASVAIIFRLFYPFDKSLSDMKASIEAMAAYKRLTHFIETKTPPKALSLPEPKGKLEVESVSCALKGKTILHNISFTLEPGESLGILAPSFAGKTSLCKVMLGISEAVAGKIRLDGAEVSQWLREEFGRYVGYMPQEPDLFPGTVAENISRLQTVDSEKVVKAGQDAGVHDIIVKLPQGYDTPIDHTGKNLSAGQRQLISLARAMYGEPKLVVLDEPHTFLDEPGFIILLNFLKNLKQKKVTAVIVTDRPNMLIQLDKILVIKQGQVAMCGPSKDVFEKLANRQQPQQNPGV